jgi:hypothetical protein
VIFVNIKNLLSAALAAAALMPAGAQAGDMLSLGIGYYDVFDDDNAVDFRAEYRFDAPLFWSVKPWVGAEVTSDGSLYGAGGLLLDLPLSDNWMLTPSIGAGAFSDGDGKDLGYGLEFRSQLEVSYKFVDQSRVGVAFSHISNADLGDDNPGTEVLDLYYHLPVSWF